MFVENAALMVASHDLDHRYYEYPGLFFYLLAPAVALARAGTPPGPAAYVAARGVVAAFGVLNVLLLYRLGARLAGPGAALVAASLLAVSPVDVEAAHMVRADVVLGTFVLAALACLDGVGAERRGDVRAGFALGAAGAVKFTGALLLPTYLARRGLAPGPRLRGTLAAGLAAATAFALLSPYALLHASAFSHDAATQIGFHYQKATLETREPLAQLGNYAAVWPKALGWPAVLLVFAGLWRVRREWRTWLPLVLLPLTTAAVFATQDYRFDRHMVPSLGVLAILAGVGLAWLCRERPLPLAAAAVVALGLPCAAAVSYVRAIGAPSTRDRALDWLSAHVEPGARIVSTVAGLGLDRNRYDVVQVEQPGHAFVLPAMNADVVVTAGEQQEAALERVPVVFTAAPGSAYDARTVRVRLLGKELKPAYRSLDLEGARLTVSQDAEHVDALRDGRLDTSWSAERSAGRSWIEVELPDRVRLAAVELVLPDAEAAAHGLALVTSTDGLAWDRVDCISGRAPVEEQPLAAGPPSQLLLFPPRDARLVMVTQNGRGARRWAVAELRLLAVDGARPGTR